MAGGHSITVLVAGHDALFREGLTALLGREDGIRVVGESADGDQAFGMVEALKPHVVLLDIRTPGMDGLRRLSEVRAKSPETRVLVFAAFVESDLAAKVLERGARGYIVKTATLQEVVKAIRAVHAGEIWAQRKVLTALLDGFLADAGDHHRPLSAMFETLTDREQEIARRVIEGRTNKEIGVQLRISHKTVKTHLSHIFRKLNVNRRVELLLGPSSERSDPSPALPPPGFCYRAQPLAALHKGPTSGAGGSPPAASAVARRTISLRRCRHTPNG